MDRALVEQHVAVLYGFRSFFDLALDDHWTNVDVPLLKIHLIRAQCDFFLPPQAGRKGELKECGVYPSGPVLSVLKTCDDAVGLFDRQRIGIRQLALGHVQKLGGVLAKEVLANCVLEDGFQFRDCVALRGRRWRSVQ